MRHEGGRTPVVVPPCPAHELETVENGRRSSASPQERGDACAGCGRDLEWRGHRLVHSAGGGLTRIRRALLTGELRPGQRIKEVHLAEALGVSRPTLRESLQQLVHEGALVQVPYKGIHVAQPTPEELRDVAEVRMPLETMAALRLSRNPDGPAMDGVRDACGRTSPRSGPETTSRPI